MINLQLNMQADTEDRLIYLLSQYSDKDLFFRNIINYQLSLLNVEMMNFKVDMDAFEKKYNMLSEDFFKLYKEGKTDDSHDTLEWAGLCEMYEENLNKLASLK